MDDENYETKHRRLVFIGYGCRIEKENIINFQVP